MSTGDDSEDFSYGGCRFQTVKQRLKRLIDGLGFAIEFRPILHLPETSFSTPIFIDHLRLLSLFTHTHRRHRFIPWNYTTSGDIGAYFLRHFPSDSFDGWSIFCVSWYLGPLPDPSCFRLASTTQLALMKMLSVGLIMTWSHMGVPLRKPSYSYVKSFFTNKLLHGLLFVTGIHSSPFLCHSLQALYCVLLFWGKQFFSKLLCLTMYVFTGPHK